MHFRTFGLAILFTLSIHSHAQRLGGNSGGGGNIKPPTPLTEAGLANFIETSVPNLVLWHFNFMFNPFALNGQTPAWLQIEEDFLGFTKDVMQSAFRKMFLETETIFDRIPKAKIKLQKEKCADPLTGELRAAAANADTNEICFSSSEIIANSPAEELRGYILGLALHEYSHLRGTTETEAEMIAVVARYLSAVDGVILSRVEQKWKDRYEGEESQQPIEKLLKRMDSYSDIKLALSLMSIAHQVSEDINAIETLIGLSGLSPWTAKQRFDAITAVSKAANLKSYVCSFPEQAMDKSDLDECHPKDSIDAMLGGANEVLLGKLYESSGARLLLAPDWKLRRVAHGNREAVRAELTDLLAILRDLFPKPVASAK